MKAKEIGGSLNAAGMKIAIVVSRFNDFFTKQLLSGAMDSVVRHGGEEKNIIVVWVPGANELPMAVRRIAAGGKQDAVVALGCVVQGATVHAELINTQVSRSLAKIAEDTGAVVINGVVCAGNLEQAIERSGTKAGNKGWQAAQTAIEMVNLYKSL